ncbi:MAG: efflux RND transporter periplasmic adaptor subunit [Trichloromonadaceae bacterium]
MTKRMLFALLGLVLVVALIGGIKALQIRKMIAQGSQFVPPPETVTTAVAETAAWGASLRAVGSLDAVQGVTVSAEVPGKIVALSFEAGQTVAKGAVLLQLDTSTEMAQLPGAEAEAALAKSNLQRFSTLLEQKIISNAEHDAAVAGYRLALSQADNLRAVIAKKTVRAPFAGRLGIRQVNLGQILREGDPIVSLQAPDPLYVNFQLTQSDLPLLQVGLPVQVTFDAAAEVFEARLSAINPEVDMATRNIRIQATLSNPQGLLRPGMFANVVVVLPDQSQVLVIPATAILYAPYSDSVFVVEPKDPAKADAGLVLRQQFVRIEAKRGDFVALASGLKAGETVASTGVFKLRNGQDVVVDNTLAPDFKLAPRPENN